MRRPGARSLAALVLAAVAASPAPGAASAELRSFTLAAAGDILIQEPIADAAEAALPGEGTYDFTALLGPVEPWISAADFAICHLDSTLSPDNNSLLYDENRWPRFSGPREVAAAIAAAGFDACSLSSNHAWDRGTTGIAETITTLDAFGILHTGTARTPEERLPALYEVAGVRVAHISYSTGTNFRPLPQDARWVMNVMDTEAILADARWAREQGAEFTIVSLHWGTPAQMPPDGPQLAVAATLTASPDIDLILGHHTHMVQPITRVNGKPVVYGMGDLLSDLHGGPSRGVGAGDGIIVHLTVAEQPGGGFAVTETAATPTWTDPATKRVLPVDHSLAAGVGEPLAALLETSRALTVERIRLLGDRIPLTPTPWPALDCAGHPATIVGTPGPDVIVGTPGDDVVVGRGGGDLILAGGGDDLVCGGEGDDAVWGGDGNDALHGDAGADLLSGGSGADRVSGGEGSDRLGGGDGNDTLAGEGGDDSLSGHGGDDLLDAGAGRDVLWGGTGHDLLIASSPETVLRADAEDACRRGSGASPCP
jgi:poly-gamma-glutamate synthesis protein (capsule biosynthesis protein)